jgi:hypothetical protein
MRQAHAESRITHYIYISLSLVRTCEPIAELHLQYDSHKYAWIVLLTETYLLISEITQEKCNIPQL